MRDNLDQRSADALLSGALSPEDAPPLLRDLAHLLNAARPAALGDEIPMEREVVSAFAAAVASSGVVVQLPASGRRHLLRKVMSAKIAAVAAVLALTGTAAAAATGSLPASLQAAAASVASHLGITLPSPHHPGAGGINSGAGVTTTSGRPGTTLATFGTGTTTTSDGATPGTTGRPGRTNHPGTGHTTGGSHPQSGPPVVADAHGLCTAFTAVTDDFTNFSNPALKQSKAFGQLIAAAVAKDESVKQFCAAVPPPGKGKGGGGGNGNGGNGNGNGGKGNGGNGNGNGNGGNGNGNGGSGNGGGGNGGGAGGKAAAKVTAKHPPRRTTMKVAH